MLPSASVLQSMEETGLGHREWVMEMSRRHQQSLREQSLTPDVAADFERMSRESLAEQREIEADSTQPFAQFLEEYLRS